ncbi:mucin-3A [Xyrichtys novacula]|nr:mucin-3A [Xyrichtys novacula]
MKYHTRSDKQTDPVEAANPPRTMLSSSMVTVLAPHWSGKLRRGKRFEGISNPEAQGALQDVTNSRTNREYERFQGTMDRSPIHRSHEPMRVPFPDTRRNTETWSTKSGPAGLDYERRRKMSHTVSLDINYGRMDNRNMDPLSPVATTPSPTSPHSPAQIRSPQSLNQSGLSPLSSKPTTSSLLLSLRRFNSSSRLSTAGSPLSEMNPAPALQTRLSQTRLSQTRLDNEKDKPNPLLSPSSISSKTADTAPLHSPLSPLSTNQREKTVFETRFFPDKPKEKNTEGSRQPKTITRAQSSLLTSKQALITRGLTERHQNFRGQDTNLFSQNFGSSPRLSNEQSPCILPRRTTLTSTSWWKQVSQEGSSPPELSDTMRVKDKPNTPCAPPGNNNKSDIKRLNNSQIANNRHNNNTTESVCKSSMKPLTEQQGGSQNLNQRISEDSPEHDSDKLVSQQNGSRFNNREPQKPQSLPDAFLRSKISRATALTTLSHPKEVREDDESEKAFTANTGGLTPTLQNPRALNAPTESISQHQNNQCALNTNSSITSPHSKDSQSSIPPPLSPAITNVLNSQPLIPKTAPENYEMDASFHSLPVSGQKTILTQSHTDSSSQPSTFTVGVTPPGFEKSYDYVTKTFQPKTASTLVPTFKVFSEAKTIPLSTSVKQPAATDAPSIPRLTPTTVSSLLTPPATPNITSPDSDSSSPREGSDFSSGQERDSKKQRSEGKRARRVTWEDSVDPHNSEPIKVKSQELSQAPTSPLSAPRSSPSNRAPSFFSFLRSSSPNIDAYPLCSPVNRTTSMQEEKGGNYRSFSSDSADLASREKDKSKLRLSDPLILDQKTQEVPISRQEGTLSVESDTVQCRSSAALSLPDFSSGYKLRYSSPPYSTLMSARSTQGETKPSITPRSQLFPQSLNYTPHLSKNTPLSSAMTSPTTKASPTLISSLQPSALSLQTQPPPQERSNFRVSETYQLNNNNSKTNSQDRQIFLVNNRVQIGSRSPQGAEAQDQPPTCVTETLVYGVKPKGDGTASKNSTLQPLQQAADRAVMMESKFSQRQHRVQSQETAGEPVSRLEQCSSGSSSTDSHSTDEGRRKIKDSVLFKSRFFSVENNNEQSPKKSRFALKKSISTPNSNLSRSESDKANKTNNRVDQVLSRLRQTFSPRRTDDDVSFPWKWRRGSQTPSISGSSDVSGDAPPEAKTPEKLAQEKEEVLMDSEKEADDNSQWTHNRHSRLSTPMSGGSVENFYVWSEKSPSEKDHVQQSSGTDHTSKNKIKQQLANQSPTIHPFDLYKDNRTDIQPANQLLSSPDPSPGRSSNLSTGYPSQFRKSTPSPRSPFSPFNSLSPLSPFPTPEVADDVFYSPKLQRRRESPSPGEEKPGEGFSLSDSRRTRISTGPPSPCPCPGPGQDKNGSASLKYGIEPRRLFSVSSIQSCRPSGPGRISTGSRFMSVGDLSEPALTGGETRKDLDRRSVSPDWTTKFDSIPSKDRLMSYFPSDPGKMRTRSLPRSLTRRLANWSSEVLDSPPEASTSKPARLWSPNSMNTCHFTWDTECPPTPPPTPPLSPVPRRMSKPSSQSPPACPLSPGPQKVESSPSRGHLPSRGYVSSLSPYKESSDSSSDTTTDDEYYLETGEDDKETEL